MSAPQRYVEWINSNLGFNPRSQANSNALSEFILDDLRAECSLMDRLVSSNVLSSLKNASVSTHVTVRNVDLVLYEHAHLPQLCCRVSVEHKTLMTAHGKARLNRYGDIIAYCNHMHNHNRTCIVGATVVINVSALYKNPDSFAQNLVRRRLNMEKVVKDTVKVFTGIPLRESPDDPNDQPEALAVIVVNYDGTNPASLVTTDLAPAEGSHAHYNNFLRRLAQQYEHRFGG
jgi:hypothetical protein